MWQQLLHRQAVIIRVSFFGGVNLIDAFHYHYMHLLSSIFPHSIFLWCSMTLNVLLLFGIIHSHLPLYILNMYHFCHYLHSHLHTSSFWSPKHLTDERNCHCLKSVCLNVWCKSKLMNHREDWFNVSVDKYERISIDLIWGTWQEIKRRISCLVVSVIQTEKVAWNPVGGLWYEVHFIGLLTRSKCT